MAVFPLNEHRSRYDQDLADEVLAKCKEKRISLSLRHQDSEFNSRVLHYKLETDDPYLILDSLVPAAGNELAKQKLEFAVQSAYLHEGEIYHVRYHLILWGAGEHKGMPIVYATPPLDVKIAAEHFAAKPSKLEPILIKIPLFDKELELEVKMISLNGLIFEDRLVADSLPAVSKYNRLTLLMNDHEYIIHGGFRGRGNHIVEFEFARLESEFNDVLEAYLEEQFATHGTHRASKEDGKHLERAKKQQIRPVKLMLLSDDAEYISRLQPMMKNEFFKVEVKDACTIFSETVYEFDPDIVFIDDKVKDLDLWNCMRDYKARYQENEKPAPALILSDDTSEDALVYAQYCGAHRLISRNRFVEGHLKTIVDITGRKELLSGKTEDQVEKRPILIIDDDKNVINTLSYALEQSDYKPIIAQNGSDGVRLAKEHKPVCILLEVAVRSGDGINALRMLKKMPFTAKTPLLVLTASRDPQDLMAAKQNRVEAYLNKPKSTDEILNEIHKRVGD